uniref:Alternative protein ZNF804A n=1 Tax=Homo sapiens TaxID=9606 RepID=L8E9U1_HUMAN|nr:alternative protein ZNF804A [Homo sapiens]
MYLQKDSLIMKLEVAKINAAKSLLFWLMIFSPVVVILEKMRTQVRGIKTFPVRSEKQKSIILLKVK